MKPGRWAFSVACLLAAATASATAPRAFYVGQSLLWRDRATGAVGELWLNADGRYAVFYDSARATVVPGMAGPFRWEGREGAYLVTAAPDGAQLCLRPDGDVIPRGTGAGAPIFHAAGCDIIPVHPIGEVFPVGYAGHVYDVVLEQGR
jgi:hypothetical protein